MSKNNFDDKLVCWKADRAKKFEVSNMPYLHKLVKQSSIIIWKLETNMQQVQLKALLLQLTQVFFWPAYHNSWTIFNTVVCLSKHISKCHLNEILDKSVIICADKRWTSTLEQQSVQLSNNKWSHLTCFKFFSIYFNQSLCIVWQCWVLCWIVIRWTYQKPVLKKSKS